MKDMIQIYYKRLFTKDSVCDPTMAIRGAFPKLSAEQWDGINRRVSYEEVEEALMSMSPVKAPGHDGLHALFYQKTWSLVKDQVSLVENFL